MMSSETHNSGHRNVIHKSVGHKGLPGRVGGNEFPLGLGFLNPASTSIMNFSGRGVNACFLLSRMLLDTLNLSVEVLVT